MATAAGAVLRILVVDDNVDAAESLATLLRGQFGMSHKAKQTYPVIKVDEDGAALSDGFATVAGHAG